MHRTLRVKQNLGKYRLERRLGSGGFAVVFKAYDTIEGVYVALKIPYPHLVSQDVLNDFRAEVRLASRLDHPNILPIKNADFIDDHFVIATPLGERTLAERLERRLALPTALDLITQLLEALAYAHQQRIIHCDVKPENFILFPDNLLRLTDFGIAKVAMRTVRASGSGTVGYIAPEQAMGMPSYRSDVFSAGLVIYRILAGRLPEFPFEWPLPGFDRLRRRTHPDMIDVLRKAIQLDPRGRYHDAEAMLTALQRAKTRTLKHINGQSSNTRRRNEQDWQAVRRQQFQRLFGKQLNTQFKCTRCQGPVSECMYWCPWCGVEDEPQAARLSFPAHCPRCHRGVKLDWRFCAWCFGEGFEVSTNRQFTDKRYTAKCDNPKCSRKILMPFMRYCPWCRRKVRRPWRISGHDQRCQHCKWGVVASFWSFCPWCGKRLGDSH